MTTVTSEAILWGQETTVTSESIRYSAVFDPTSTAEGTEAVKSQLIDAASRCPTSKIVILGFSQGALIVGDALGGGGGGPMGPRTPGMNESFIREHISAVALFGDPRHNVADQFNRGTATSGGWYPRDAEAVAKLNEIKDLMVGYCDFNDSFCASGEDLPLHVGNEATEFVAGKVESFPFPTM
ncbi:hypothetical protein HK104_000306 [Borealophlyctis nickersoniae]|nr:hypothetical protein HK104_000306 [Borealophlyctis nickersoniae]